MKQITWLLKWILRAAIFFALLAFALNNRHEVTVNFFFANVWQAPLVLVLLVCFAAGLLLGMLAMLPRWYKQRRAARRARRQAAIANSLTVSNLPPHES